MGINRLRIRIRNLDWAVRCLRFLEGGVVINKVLDKDIILRDIIKVRDIIRKGMAIKDKEVNLAVD